MQSQDLRGHVMNNGRGKKKQSSAARICIHFPDFVKHGNIHSNSRLKSLEGKISVSLVELAAHRNLKRDVGPQLDTVHQST